MLVKSNVDVERKIINQLIAEDETLRKQHELFEAEMSFKQELINARKRCKLTQKDVSEKSGLSQQAVSRLEKGAGGTVETIIKYLDTLGYSLSIKQVNRI